MARNSTSGLISHWKTRSAIKGNCVLIEQEGIIRYWHAVELLQPQSAPKPNKRSSHYEAFIHDTPILRPILPWAPASIVSKQVLPKSRVWSHTVYAHLYDSRLVAEKLMEVYGAEKAPQVRARRPYCVI